MNEARPQRWFHHSYETAYQAGIECGDPMPPITSIGDGRGRSLASSHDLFTFDGDVATLMAAAGRLRELAEKASAALKRNGDDHLAAEIDALLARIARGDVEGKVHDAMNAIAASMPRNSSLEWEIFAHQDRMTIHKLTIPKASRGCGTTIVKRIFAVADENKLAIDIVADPTDAPGDPDGPALERWYARLGFRVTGRDDSTLSPTMRREPA